MKLLATLALALSLATSAQAAELRLIGVAEDALLVDRQSISRTGNTARFWAVTVFSTPLEAQTGTTTHLAMYYEAVCNTQQVRQIHARAYSFDGKMNEEWAGHGWDFVAPGSVEADMFQFVCEPKSQTTFRKIGNLKEFTNGLYYAKRQGQLH